MGNRHDEVVPVIFLINPEGKIPFLVLIFFNLPISLVLPAE